MSTIRFYAFSVVAFLIPELSFAHSSIEGIGSFYNGLLHPILVPAHLLLLVATGLFLGQQGPKEIQSAFAIFTVSNIAGLIAAWFSLAPEAEAVILALSTIIGLLVAIAPKVGLIWCGMIAVLAGLHLGIDSAQETLTGKEKLVTLFGSGFTICVLTLYSMLLSDHFNKKKIWKIGIRVIGSWIAASSLLVLALVFST